MDRSFTATKSKKTRNTEDEIIDKSLIPTFGTQFQ